MTGLLRPLSLIIALAAGTACGDSPTTATATIPEAIGENAGTSTIVVSAITSGVFSDSASYVVSIDGTPKGSIGPNGQLVVRALKRGNHVVTLAGAPPDCRMKAPQQIVRATTGSMSGANFQIFCGETSRILVRARTSTNGTSVNDGYTVALDGGQPEHIDPNGTLMFLDVKVGEHEVRLSGIPEGCGHGSFEGFWPTSSMAKGVDVEGGRDANVFFFVDCP